MQSKFDIERKYATALNDLMNMERSRNHWQRTAEFHIDRGKRRGWAIQTERQRYRYKLYIKNLPWWKRLFYRMLPV